MTSLPGQTGLQFVQVQGRRGIIEASLPEQLTLEQLHDALPDVSIKIEGELLLLIDGAEHRVQCETHERLPRLERDYVEARAFVLLCERRAAFFSRRRAARA
jgi:hypothetical protein